MTLFVGECGEESNVVENDPAEVIIDNLEDKDLNSFCQFFEGRILPLKRKNDVLNKNVKKLKEEKQTEEIRVIDLVTENERLGKTHIKKVGFLIVRPLRSGYPTPLDLSDSYLIRKFFPLQKFFFCLVVRGGGLPLSGQTTKKKTLFLCMSSLSKSPEKFSC